MSSMQDAVVVTGASTGIGRATAERLAADGRLVFATVRKPADADALTAALGARVRPIFMDVSVPAEVERAGAEVRAALGGATLKGLVNNAGVALPGPALTQPIEEIERTIDVNLMGVIRSCRAFGPLLHEGEGARGRIVNVTSVSGRFGFPFTAAYVATKHAVEGFSASLRRELLLVGVDVIVVGPGSVKTPIWSKGAAFDKARYADTIWGGPLERLVKALAKMDEQGLEASDVADVIAQALTTPRPKTRYAPVRGPIANWWAPTLLPARMIDRVVGEALGLIER